MVRFTDTGVTGMGLLDRDAGKSDLFVRFFIATLGTPRFPALYKFQYILIVINLDEQAIRQQRP